MNTTMTKLGISTLALAALACGTEPAKAQSWGFAIGGGPRWVEPVYTTQARTIVLPAQYEERPRQIWREPVYEERRTLVQIPPRTEIRQVPRYVNGVLVGHEQQTVIVEPGRQEWRTERVLVQPGRWDTVVERVLVAPERAETVYEQVLVSPGYWELAPGFSFGYVDRDKHKHREHHRHYRGPRGIRVRDRD